MATVLLFDSRFAPDACRQPFQTIRFTLRREILCSLSQDTPGVCFAHMELRHLRYFVAVAEEENVTRAANRLHVSQPPLSRQIRDLEEELGLKLFERTPKSVRLTEAGRIFLTEAREVLERVAAAERLARVLAAGNHGEIHVGYAPSLTVEILSRALRHFREICPGVRVHLHDLSTAEMLAGLIDGSLQVALTVEPPRKALRALDFKPLREYAVCVAVHPAHPVARSKKISRKQVAAERLIAYSRDQYPEYHDWLARLFSETKVPEIAEEHHSSTSLIASVESGRGIALVQQGFESLSGPRLTVRQLDPPPPPFVLGVACRNGSGSESTARFVAATIRAAKETLS